MSNHISFEEYCEDFIDQDSSLMSDAELKEAKEGFRQLISGKSASAQVDLHDNEGAMLAYHGITKETFENLTHDQLPAIRKVDNQVCYKDPKRQLWHDFRDYLAEQKKTSNKTRDAQTQKALDRAADSRTAAKALGGKALTGTPKQKAWAESIRRDFLRSVSSDAAEMALTSKKAASAKFWIETRECSNDDIIACIRGEVSYKQLAEQTRKAALKKKLGFRK